MRFKAGDVCVIVRWDSRDEWVGREVTILGRRPHPYRTDKHGVTRPQHSDAVCVDAPWFPDHEHIHNNNAWVCSSSWLRLRRPPSWDEWLTKTNTLDDGDKRDVKTLQVMEREPHMGIRT